MVPGALVDRVLFEPRGGGWHAQAVCYTDAGGATHTAEGKLIIVCASAFGSPTLLMRSGIGEGLQVNLPHVGRNYVNQAVGFMSIEYDRPLHGQFGYAIGTVVQVDYHRPGHSYLIATFGQGHLGLMLGTQWGQRFKNNMRNWRNWGGAFVFPVFTTAVGRVTLDPTKSNGAKIEYAISPQDQALIETGYREAARIFMNMNRLSGPKVKTIETVPQPLMASHAQGTCRMGRSPADSVVNLDLVVHGFDNLMVVDGSVMPVQVQSPHYPISALAHKIADTYIRRELWNIP
jgi:choline dehydrogenase-like flavoprotein